MAAVGGLKDDEGIGGGCVALGGESIRTSLPNSSVWTDGGFFLGSSGAIAGGGDTTDGRLDGLYGRLSRRGG